MATNRTAAIGKLTRVTKAPKIIAKPPTTSVSIVAHAIKCGAGTPSACRMEAKASGPFASLAKPCAMKPYPTIRRSGIGAQRESGNRFHDGDGTSRNVALGLATCSRGSDVFRRDRRPKARPTRSGIDLRIRSEQRIVTTDAAIKTFLVEVPVLSGIGKLGVGLTGDCEDASGQLLAPFLFRLDHFRHVDCLQSHSRIREFNNRNFLGRALCRLRLHSAWSPQRP